MKSIYTTDQLRRCAVGTKVVYLGQTGYGHEHWDWELNHVYTIKSDGYRKGPANPRGCVPTQDWGQWKWGIVE